mgnify:FL=1
MDIEGSSKTIVIDCDGVIAARNNGRSYADADPLSYGVEQVCKLYDMGYEVILYTARYGDREGGNIHMQYQRGYQEWLQWLEKNGVKYHKAFMGKPAGALYIDDKAARVRGNSQSGWQEVWKEVVDLKYKDKNGSHYTQEQLNYWDSFVD